VFAAATVVGITGGSFDATTRTVTATPGAKQVAVTLDR